MARVSKLDNDAHSPIREFDKHIKQGFKIGRKEAVVEAIEHAQVLVNQQIDIASLQDAHMQQIDITSIQDAYMQQIDITSIQDADMQQMQIDIASMQDAVIAGELDIDIQSVVDSVFGTRSIDTHKRSFPSIESVTDDEIIAD